MVELNASKIISEAFNLIKENLEIVALYAIQLVVLGAIGIGILGINIFSLKTTNLLSTITLTKAIISLVVFVIIAIVLQATVAAATIIIVTTIKKRRKISISEALSRGIKKVPLLFAAGIVMGIIVAAGILALIIPGIYLMLRLILYQQACVIEGNLGIKRSWEITRGHVIDILVLLIILAVIAIATGLIPYIGPIINSIFVAPLSLTAWTLVYLKLAKKK